MIGFKEFLLLEKKEEKYLARDGVSIANSMKKSGLMAEAIAQINKGNILYRGMVLKDKASFYFNQGFTKGDVDDFRSPTTPNGNNFHALLDALPSWQEVNDAAPRHQAIICSSEKSKASDELYAGASKDSIYVILPENGTQLIVSSFADIHKEKWPGVDEYGERGGGQGATDLALGLGSLLAAIFGTGGASTSKTTPNFIPNLKKVTAPMIAKAIEDAKAEKNSNKASIFKQYDNMMYVTSANTLFDALNELASPKANGFKVQALSEKLPANKEIWFNNKFIAVKMQSKLTKELQDFCAILKLDVKHFIL